MYHINHIVTYDRACHWDGVVGGDTHCARRTRYRLWWWARALKGQHSDSTVSGYYDLLEGEGRVVGMRRIFTIKNHLMPTVGFNRTTLGQTEPVLWHLRPPYTE